MRYNTIFKLLAGTSCSLVWKSWKHGKWQSDGNFLQNAQLGRFQTGIGLLWTLILALTGLFQEMYYSTYLYKL